MAVNNSLVERLDEKFPKCGICLGSFCNPRGLPCLHSFCHECLEGLCKGRKQVLCPNCKKPTAVPKEGVSGFPAHFMVKSLGETINLGKLKIQGGPKEDTPCGNCKQKEKKATVQCFDCNLLFCETCHESHNLLEPMKKHQVISVENLRSGKMLVPVTTNEDQICEMHDGEAKQFYCETCEKTICRDCIVMKQHCRDHDYMSLKDASKKQARRLKELTTQCKVLSEKCQEALQETETVEKNLGNAVKEGKRKVEELKDEYKKHLEDIFNKHEVDILALEKQRTKQLGCIKEKLQTTLSKVESACDLSTQVTQIGTYYDITNIYPTLSASLETLSKVPTPRAADEALSCMAVQKISKPEVVATLLTAETWKKTSQFSIKSELGNPIGITSHPDGDVLVTSYERSAKVFSKDGVVKYVFEGSFDAFLTDPAITPDGKYILPGTTEILFYDNQGKFVKSAPTCDINNEPSDPKSLAVDIKGRIIVGLCGTVAIHHRDGTSLSKFALRKQRRLAITTNGDIAASFHGNTVQLMDYSGGNVRVVQRPTGVSKWNPWGICCSKQGEIFVVNVGNPKAVYKYTADGDQCLGCVITGLDDPRGIAITEDGKQLLVAEYKENVVKIFQR